MITILALSGSLRKQSSNTTLLRVAATMAPQGSSITIYCGLNESPHFNPDLEGIEPSSVIGFRHALQNSDGVLISTPEYAHGIPGVLQNALDWIVGSGELVSKPVALLMASPRATYAQASLRETITVMSARLVEAACVMVPLLGKDLDEAGILSRPEMSDPLRASLMAFTSAIEALRRPPD